MIPHDPDFIALHQREREAEANRQRQRHHARRSRPLSKSALVAARIRMPLVAISTIGFILAVVFGAGTWRIAGAFVVYVFALALYVRAGTPRGPSVDIGSPVHGRWLVVNSPSTKVPSHGVHAWAQTHACDLVADPDRHGRPPTGWWPLARRPEDYPGFGAELRSPVDGVVVRAVDAMRDHWSRTSPVGILYLIVETVRELFGPVGILGNYVVIRSDGERDVYVAMAHLQRRSLTVRNGDRVAKGDVVARCGNSGNSTEPHLHIQAMDKRSPWIAPGVPFTIDGRPLPPTDHHLDAATPGRRADRVMARCASGTR